jgi:hypothetical protein
VVPWAAPAPSMRMWAIKQNLMTYWLCPPIENRRELLAHQNRRRALGSSLTSILTRTWKFLGPILLSLTEMRGSRCNSRGHGCRNICRR